MAISSPPHPSGIFWYYTLGFDFSRIPHHIAPWNLVRSFLLALVPIREGDPLRFRSFVSPGAHHGGDQLPTLNLSIHTNLLNLGPNPYPSLYLQKKKKSAKLYKGSLKEKGNKWNLGAK